MQSENINELAAALAKAQGEMQAPKKDKTAKAGTYSYGYADLASVIDAVRGPLSKHGLSFAQLVTMSERGITLQTTLMHSSGQWIGCEYPLLPGGTAQARGSDLTYARRYSLCAITGIAAEDDDDGQAASQHKPGSGNGHTRPPAPRPAPVQEPPMDRDLDAEYRQTMNGTIPDDPPGEEPEQARQVPEEFWSRGSYAINATTLDVWAKRYEAAMKETGNEDQIAKLADDNAAKLDALKAAAPPRYKDLLALTAAQRRKFMNPLAA